MKEINVIYWSGTGNTEAMATAIAEGVNTNGATAKVQPVADASVDALKDASCFALGCPSMGVEVLEESEMEPFVCDLEKIIAGKSIALFGSYGWGDGEWMRNWTQRMEDAGEKVINGEGLICQDSPDSEAEASCINLGKILAEM